MSQKITRRNVLKSTLGWGAATIMLGRGDSAHGFTSSLDRPLIGAIGTGSRWCQKATGIDRPYGSAPDFKKYGDYIAVCDADEFRTGLAKKLVKDWSGKDATIEKDYRKILDQKNVDIVHITTPDHWHAKMLIEAMQAGKDVYCEKPMTLTIEEGRMICEVAKKTGRIVQIGTQQRSSRQFIKAIAMINDGRIGDVKKATCGIGGAPTSPEIPVATPPESLDWNLWLGPAPEVKYRSLAGNKNETKSWSRSHYEFRWWYEYSGGKLTDWGAHHVDIATWGMGKTETGPIIITPKNIKHPVEFKDGYPTDDSRYNTATSFHITAEFADGMQIEIRHDTRNGILFEGTKGRIFVNRGTISGKPVDELKEKPLADGAMQEAYKGHALTNHFQNFFESARDRKEPISDVFSHHRALSTCHLASISARLNRKLRWDPKNEKIVGDEQAQNLVGREQRKGFEIKV